MSKLAISYISWDLMIPFIRLITLHMTVSCVAFEGRLTLNDTQLSVRRAGAVDGGTPLSRPGVQHMLLGFRGGLAFEAHRLSYHPAFGSRTF